MGARKQRMMLRVYLLGGFSMTWEDQPLAPPPSLDARSLLAYLVTYRRAHTRALLAGTFWSDLPDARAHRRLSQALWQIRRALKPLRADFILSDSDSVQFDPDAPVWVDAWEFEQEVDKYTGRQGDKYTGGQGDLPTCLPVYLSTTVNLYRGDFLAGFYDDWILLERERLREMYLHALEQLAQSLKSSGQYQAALEFALKLAQADPLRESAHREVMRLYFALDRPDAALKQFAACRAMLHTELALEPEPETVALAQEIATRSGTSAAPYLPATRLPTAPLALERAPTTLIPLVGRGEERAQLLAFIEALFGGSGGIALVEGEAGVGKTRLLQEIARDAEWRGAQVLWGRGRELEAASPYAPIVEALAGGLSPLRAEQLTRLLEPLWLNALRPLLPNLPGAIAPLARLEPMQERARLVEALARGLAAWAQIMPLLLILEDLHWADADTLDVLARLVRRLERARVGVIGTYRGEDARAQPTIWDALQSLDRAGRCERVTLNRLDAEATSELVSRGLGLAQAAPLFAQRLFRETEGNPLFVLETLRTLRDEGLLTRDASGAWRTPWDETTRDYAEMPLPVAVERVIARRLAQLSPDQRRTLRAAAILGSEFDFAFLGAVNDLDTPTTLGVLGELARRRLIEETLQGYRFSHDKVRQVSYAEIAEAERRELHRRAGAALEQAHPERVAALAHHFFAGAVWAQAARYNRQAGDAAARVYAHREAAAHYTRALEALEHLGAVIARTSCPLAGMSKDRNSNCHCEERVVRRSNPQWANWRLLRQKPPRNDKGKFLSSEAIAKHPVGKQSPVSELEIASQKSLAMTKGEILFDLRAARETAYAMLGERAAQADDLNALEELAREPALDSPARRAQIALRWVGYHEAVSDYPAALAAVERAAESARVADDASAEYQAHLRWGRMLRHRGELAAGREHLERAHALAQMLGDSDAQATALNDLGVVFGEAGDWNAALERYQRALDAARRTDQPMTLAAIHNSLGNFYHTTADFHAALEQHQRALALRRAIGDRRNEGASLYNLSLVYHDSGDNASARRMLEQVCEIAHAIGDRRLEGYGYVFLALVLEYMGEFDAARAAYTAGLALRREVGLHALAIDALAGLARVATAQGNHAQASAYADEVLTWLTTRGIAGVGDPLLAYVGAYRALFAAGETARGEAALRTAYDLLIRQAATIADEERRRAFIHDISPGKHIWDDYQRLTGDGQRVTSDAGRVERQRVRLARADAPTGRARRDDEYVQVVWTIAAPEDAAIANKAARRRQRLRRLLAEAAAQNAAPTHTQLADALGVGVRTVERDVAALRGMKDEG